MKKYLYNISITMIEWFYFYILFNLNFNLNYCFELEFSRIKNSYNKSYFTIIFSLIEIIYKVKNIVIFQLLKKNNNIYKVKIRYWNVNI
jgi:hypothetical protein